MPLIIPANTLTGGYDVANSCRFNSADSAYLKRTQGTPTIDQIGTISLWFKRSSLGNSMLYNNYVSGVPQAEFCYLDFRSDDEIRFACDDPGTFDRTPQDRYFRDVSAWYHFVGTIDTTQGVEADRIKLYINGEQITSTWRYAVMPSQNDTINLFTASAADQNKIGVHYNGSGYYNYFNGYMSEFVYCDGQAYAASSFGEFDEDSPTIWKPKDVSGLTFGDEGFYLSFSDSADLGADSSGNSNDFTVSNLDATDQCTDTPTNNFATANPLDHYYFDGSYTNGNVTVTSDSSSYTWNTGTFGVSKGKWYWEIKVITETTGSQSILGISSTQSTGVTQELGDNANDYGYYASDGNSRNNNTGTSYGNTYAVGDIINFALDLDNNKLYFGKNGTWQNSGVPTSGATGTGAISITAPSSTSLGFYFPAWCFYDSNNYAVWDLNFGGCPAFAISSGNADADGYGNFEYAVPSGYYALCTKNLAEYG